MAVKEIKTRVGQTLGFNANISSDTTTTGAILDTKGYDLGVTFGLAATGYTDGTYTLLIEEGDDAALADAAVVSGDYLVGSLPEISAAAVDGELIPSVGVISTKRYLRLLVSKMMGATSVAPVFGGRK